MENKSIVGSAPLRGMVLQSGITPQTGVTLRGYPEVFTTIPGFPNKSRGWTARPADFPKVAAPDAAECGICCCDFDGDATAAPGCRAGHGEGVPDPRRSEKLTGLAFAERPRRCMARGLDAICRDSAESWFEQQDSVSHE